MQVVQAEIPLHRCAEQTRDLVEVLRADEVDAQVPQRAVLGIEHEAGHGLVSRGVHLEVEAVDRGLVGLASLAVEREQEEAAALFPVVVLAVLVLRAVNVDESVARRDGPGQMVGTWRRAGRGRLGGCAGGGLAAGRFLRERTGDTEHGECGEQDEPTPVPPHHGSRKNAWLFEPWIAVWQRVQSR